MEQVQIVHEKVQKPLNGEYFTGEDLRHFFGMSPIKFISFLAHGVLSESKERHFLILENIPHFDSFYNTSEYSWNAQKYLSDFAEWKIHFLDLQDFLEETNFFATSNKNTKFSKNITLTDQESAESNQKYADSENIAVADEKSADSENIANSNQKVGNSENIAVVDEKSADSENIANSNQKSAEREAENSRMKEELKNLEVLQDEAFRLKNENHDLQDEAFRLKSENHDLQDEVIRLKSENHDLQNENSSLKNKNYDLHTEVSKLAIHNEALEKTSEGLNEAFSLKFLELRLCQQDLDAAYAELEELKNGEYDSESWREAYPVCALIAEMHENGKNRSEILDFLTKAGGLTALQAGGLTKTDLGFQSDDAIKKAVTRSKQKLVHLGHN